MYRLIWAMLLIPAVSWAASAPVKIYEGDTITAQTDVTTVVGSNVVLAAANENRGALTCHTTTEIRWGDTSISDTKGLIISAGTPFVIHNTAIMYVRATTDPGTVSCTEETFSTASGSTVFSP